MSHEYIKIIKNTFTKSVIILYGDYDEMIRAPTESTQHQEVKIYKIVHQDRYERILTKETNILTYQVGKEITNNEN